MSTAVLDRTRSHPVRPMIRRVKPYRLDRIRAKFRDPSQRDDDGQLVKVLVEEAEEMLEQGLSVRRIARRTRLSMQAVWAIADRMTGGWKERCDSLEKLVKHLRHRLEEMRAAGENPVSPQVDDNRLIQKLRKACELSDARCQELLRQNRTLTAQLAERQEEVLV